MTASGYAVHWVTVARWKRQGWRANSNDDHPLDVARAKLEDIAPLATDNHPTAAQESAEQLSDPALLRQEVRMYLCCPPRCRTRRAKAGQARPKPDRRAGFTS